MQTEIQGQVTPGGGARFLSCNGVTVHLSASKTTSTCLLLSTAALIETKHWAERKRCFRVQCLTVILLCVEMDSYTCSETWIM